MAFIGFAVAMLIGIMIFSSVDEAIDCESLQSQEFQEQCSSTKSTAWVVIGILPIALFFVMFQIFGGIGGFGRDDYDKVITDDFKVKPKESFKKRVKSYIHWNPDGSIKGTKKITNLNNLSLKDKIMIALGFAKVKKSQ